MAEHERPRMGMVGPPEMGSPHAVTIEADPPSDETVFDALTSMFLGPQSSAGEPAPSERWSVELLMMGHLPVRARPWASQYAAALADRSAETVALIRIGGGYGSVELFGSPKGSLSVAAAPSLAGAVERARELATRCVVLLEGHAHDRVARHPSLNAITLLVGGNTAAIVDAYRAIKALAGEQENELPEIRVGVMGAGEGEARDALAKLSEAAEVFLDQTISSTITIERMGPTGAVSLYGDRVDLTPERAEALVLGDHVEPDESPMPAPSPPEAPVSHSDPPVELKPTTVEVPSTRSGQDAEISRLVRGVSFSHEIEPSLGALVEGLTPLDLECPYDKDGALLADEAGRLCVLRRIGDDPTALETLLAWARDHHTLLALASGGLLRREAPIRAIAFLENAAHAHRVRSHFHADLEIRLLAAVPQGARWVTLTL